MTSNELTVLWKLCTHGLKSGGLGTGSWDPEWKGKGVALVSGPQARGAASAKYTRHKEVMT